MMEGNTHNSLIGLGDISKPANTLIEKIADAVGACFEPYQIKRIAEAEAAAAIIRAKGEIELTELQSRAMHRLVAEEERKQKNIEAITGKAFPHLQPDANPEQIDNDWIANFFDKSRIVSNVEMQELWARVLAGEANKPASYSKRTVNFLGALDRTDADLFTKLCGFAWTFDQDMAPLIYDIEAAIYTNHGVTFDVLVHLDSIGLIRLDASNGFTFRRLPKQFSVTYYGASVGLIMPQDDGNVLNLGKVVLTKIGQELAPICGSQPVAGFKDYMLTSQWRAYGATPSEERGAGVPEARSHDGTA